MTMPATTGGRAVEAVLAAGFRSLDAFTDPEGRFREEFADITGNRVEIFFTRPYGDLIKAVPRGEWVRKLERLYPSWVDSPYVGSVDALERLLEMGGLR